MPPSLVRRSTTFSQRPLLSCCTRCGEPADRCRAIRSATQSSSACLPSGECAAIRATPQDFFETHAWAHQLLGQAIDLAIAGVAQHQAIFGIVQHDTLRDRLDGIDQQHTRMVRLLLGQFGTVQGLAHRRFAFDPDGDVGSAAAIAGEPAVLRVDKRLAAQLPEARCLAGRRHAIHGVMEFATGFDRRAQGSHPGGVEAELHQIIKSRGRQSKPRECRRFRRNVSI